MKQVIRTLMAAVFAVALPFMLAAAPAAAQSRIYIPCPYEIYGHIDTVGTARLPWVVALAVPADICLWVIRYNGDTDVIKTVIAPDGKVFRPTGFQVISPTIAGWYTIQIDTPPPGGEQISEMSFQFSEASVCAGVGGV